MINLDNDPVWGIIAGRMPETREYDVNAHLPTEKDLPPKDRRILRRILKAQVNFERERR